MTVILKIDILTYAISMKKKKKKIVGACKERPKLRQIVLWMLLFSILCFRQKECSCFFEKFNKLKMDMTLLYEIDLGISHARPTNKKW